MLHVKLVLVRSLDLHVARTPIALARRALRWDSLKQYRCPEWFRDAKFGMWAQRARHSDEFEGVSSCHGKAKWPVTRVSASERAISLPFASARSPGKRGVSFRSFIMKYFWYVACRGRGRSGKQF